MSSEPQRSRYQTHRRLRWPAAMLRAPSRVRTVRRGFFVDAAHHVRGTWKGVRVITDAYGTTPLVDAARHDRSIDGGDQDRFQPEGRAVRASRVRNRGWCKGRALTAAVAHTSSRDCRGCNLGPWAGVAERWLLRGRAEITARWSVGALGGLITFDDGNVWSRIDARSAPAGVRPDGRKTPRLRLHGRKPRALVGRRLLSV
eukprot:6707882-Prymnesium_polylepis.2